MIIKWKNGKMEKKLLLRTILTKAATNGLFLSYQPVLLLALV